MSQCIAKSLFYTFTLIHSYQLLIKTFTLKPVFVSNLSFCARKLYWHENKRQKHSKIQVFKKGSGIEMWSCQMCPYHWFPTWQDHSPRCEQLLIDLWHHFRKSYAALTGGAGHGGQPDGRPVGSFSAVRLLSAMSAAPALGADPIFTLTCEKML